MSISELLKEEYIWLDEKLDTKEDIFHLVFSKAYKDEKVKDSFYEGLINRERLYPTGLQLENHGVAIPHTDILHVKEEFIAIVLPEKPVEFFRMDNANEVVLADIVFVLAIKDSKSHMKTLSELMDLIQNDSLLSEILRSSDKKKIIQLIKGNEDKK